MIYKKFYIKDLSKDFANSEAYLEYYSLEYHETINGLDKYNRPGLVVIPGGGYMVCSDREAEPIALRMLVEGFNCFVVRYSCYQKYPTPQKEVAFFVNYIRTHHQEFEIIDEKLTLVGFSAGGHLAASYANYYREIADLINVDADIIKPLAIILGYPVITCGQYTHDMTAKIITDNDNNLIDKLSIEKHVSKDFPPTYIFTTKDDTVVPYQNTTFLVEQLEKNHIKYQCHIFEGGEHGGSLYTRGVYFEFPQKYARALKNRDWVNEASDFVFDLLNQ